MISKLKKGNKKMYWIVSIGVVVIAVGLFVGGKLLYGDKNLKRLGWLEAFDKLHASLVVNYPFTEWKDMDWDELYAQTAPAIEAAEANQDVEAYYLAIRQYTFSIPDGHVGLEGNDYGLRQKAIGGGYGFAIIELEDGRVITHILLEDGAASKAGMQWGAEIIEWNGFPVQQALENTPIFWAMTSQPTAEGQHLQQLYYLVRAPIGTEASILFRNPEDEAAQTILLTAEDDQLEALRRTGALNVGKLSLISSPIHSEMLSGEVGYISIDLFMPSLLCLNGGRAFNKALSELMDQGAKGIIIDVRKNVGGLDSWVPRMLSHFYEHPELYEYVSFYDDKTDAFQIKESETRIIKPSEPYFNGPVVVLVDNATASSAEGIPLAIQQLPNGYVAGIYGTDGSFAMGKFAAGKYHLPEGLAFNFYDGRAVDENLEILVDADADGVGGIVPDIRVPLTEESVYDLYVEGQDIVLQAALDKIQE